MNRSISEYCSHTLQSSNLERVSFLPCFPTPSRAQNTIDQQQKTLLLTSVPTAMLSTSQLQHRHSGAFKHQFQYTENKNIHIPSFMKFIHTNFIVNLSKQLKVDESIIDFNLSRLNDITIQSMVNRTGQHHNQENSHCYLNKAYHMHELPMALEIFLQIDVDTFFMKTCSFRGSHPRSVHGIISGPTEGVFCIDQPDTRYLMLPCTNLSCPCCYQSLDISCRRESSVRFASEQAHRFVNGYQVYLNCHASCKTTNFIYVLTCPCGQFDFVGSSHDSNESFKDVLFYHRRESIRILHEFLLGEKIIKRTLDMYEREKAMDEKKTDKMRLYRHLTECSAAFQLLLNCCVHYWYFIPMQIEEADQEDILANMTLTNQQQEQILQENMKTTSNLDSQEWSPPCERTDSDVEWCLINLPETPKGTRFSRLQINQQKIFFKNGWDLLFLPPRHLDIFEMSIVFVLPEDCSQLLCQVIESLLITHAECKLNINGHLISNKHLLSKTQGSSNSHFWYRNLVGRHYKC